MKRLTADGRVERRPSGDGDVRILGGAGGRFGRKFWIASGVNFGSLGA